MLPPPPTPSGYAGLLADLERAVTRVADRLHNLTPPRLDAPLPSGGTRAGAAYALAGWLAAAAAAVERAAVPVPPATRPSPRGDLPWVGSTTVADQVTVTGRDLLAALREVPPRAPVRSDGRTVDADEMAREALRRVQALRDLVG